MGLKNPDTVGPKRLFRFLLNQRLDYHKYIQSTSRFPPCRSIAYRLYIRLGSNSVSKLKTNSLCIHIE